MPKENIEQVNFREPGPEISDAEVDELKRLRREISLIDSSKLIARAKDFSIGLLNKYPDCSETLPYQILIGSTEPEGVEFEKRDFPGEYSVKGFLEELHREVTKEGPEQ